MFSALNHFCRLGFIWQDPEMAGAGPVGADGYVTEDGLSFYVAENGTDFYVTEA